jgi:hypothetical protein
MSSHTLRSCYAGDFDPELTLADFSRQALAGLAREYLLLGHLVDRVGVPLAMQRFGGDSHVGLSIDEWMGASPIYSLRMQRALGFEGHDVSTVFKNLQNDIGAPPQFMDFQFRLDGPDYGEFWLAHCGALLDIEPFGERQVRLMCHDIEDPTFDATAAATNPRMKMRPIHRPPRNPAGRHPHCHWKVYIDEEAAPYVQSPNLPRVQQGLIASVPIQVPAADREPGGLPDYSGPFDPGFQHEDLSQRALLCVVQEAAVQTHLLVRSYLLAVAERSNDEEAARLGRGQWTGSAALGALRLRRALAIEGDGIDAIAKVFQLHPHFHPRSYVDLRVEQSGPRSALLLLRDCPALEEADGHSWFAGLAPEPHPALDAIAGALNPRARCLPLARPAGARLAWEVVVDPHAAPRPEPPELRLARLSRGAAFEFAHRRPPRA